jgi:hypothetical protein
MCGFIWLYSMAIAMTPDAGRSAPNALLCGIGVFGIAFLLSQARQRMAVRQLVATPRAATSFVERVVLDGSIPAAPLTDAPSRRPVMPRPGVIPRDERRPERGDRA